ncbi:MAG: hydroxymethylbilane synthase [Bacilli bacterium]
MKKLRVGTRKSLLAVTQTEQTMRALGSDVEIEYVYFVTQGDRILDRTLDKIGGKGLFVSEIETALLQGDIDVAVHSLKDMPAEMTDGLMIGCVPPREDRRDVLVLRQGETMDNVQTIGTSSLRRSLQLQRMFPDKNIHWIRGNIDTRIKKLEAGEFDAIMLAAAGIKRLGLFDDLNVVAFDDAEMIPAVGQGALAVQCRTEDEATRALLARIHCLETEALVQSERTFLRTLQGSCSVPIGARSEVLADGRYRVVGLVGDEPTGELCIGEAIGATPEEAGARAAQLLKETAGFDWLQ